MKAILKLFGLQPIDSRTPCHLLVDRGKRDGWWTYGLQYLDGKTVAITPRDERARSIYAAIAGALLWARERKQLRVERVIAVDIQRPEPRETETLHPLFRTGIHGKHHWLLKDADGITVADSPRKGYDSREAAVKAAMRLESIKIGEAREW